VNVNWYIEQARLAEAAKFDLIFIVDSQFITADSPPHYLNRLEPLTLLSALAVRHQHIGLVATMTTSYNDPFNVARRLASLDLISGGRAGWNVVTSGDAGAAATSAATSTSTTTPATAAGWSSCGSPGPVGLLRGRRVPARPERGRLPRPSRQHALNHKGEHFSVVGPLKSGALAAGPAGDLPGRRLRAGPRPGREHRRGHLHPRGQSIEQGQAFYTDLGPAPPPRAATPTTS
jgi:alkanesulfonate monooxygenase SsuD/methylene tetrahydromethanopterin reductase-like flavin-dependent oxidoreductase (luciferase family)